MIKHGASIRLFPNKTDKMNSFKNALLIKNRVISLGTESRRMHVINVLS